MKGKKMVELAVSLMAVACLLAGCATVEKKTEKKSEDSVAPTPGLKNCKNFEEAGEKMVDSVFMGLSTGNYALYSRDFSEKNKQYFDKEVFGHAHNAIKEKLGEFQNETFVGFWKKGEYDILLWKARFSKTEDDILIQMYVRKIDNIHKIAALKLI